MRTNCACDGRPLGTPKCPECREESERSALAPSDATTLFAGYDAAAARLAEAKEILAINPNHPPAQERVQDALRMVAVEIGKYLEKSRPANS